MLQRSPMFWLLCLLLASLAGAQSPPDESGSGLDPAETPDRGLAAVEAQWLYSTGRDTLTELIEQAGDFGGYGGALWELTEALEPKPPALATSLEDLLLGGLEPAHANAARAFWQSPTGEKILWLRRESATAAGRRGLARSARYVQERLEPERRNLLQSLDEETHDSQSGVAVGWVLFDLVKSTWDRVSSAIDEEADWAESTAEIRSFLEGEYRDLLKRATYYRLSRLNMAELQDYLAFARSPAGKSYFESRVAALEEGAALLVDQAMPTLQAALDRELHEYEREREEEDEDEDEDEQYRR